jgi:hypothetical protein
MLSLLATSRSRHENANPGRSERSSTNSTLSTCDGKADRFIWQYTYSIQPPLAKVSRQITIRRSHVKSDKTSPTPTNTPFPKSAMVSSSIRPTVPNDRQGSLPLRDVSHARKQSSGRLPRIRACFVSASASPCLKHGADWRWQGPIRDGMISLPTWVGVFCPGVILVFDPLDLDICVELSPKATKKFCTYPRTDITVYSFNQQHELP